MPELPEITNLARQAKVHLVGKTITGFDIIQPKSLNMPVDEFCAALGGARILDACNRGKWILLETSQGWLMLNLGMGGEILLVPRGQLPEKRRLVIDLADDQGQAYSLSINFWWFGYAHYAPAPEQHEMVAKLGPNALDLSAEDLKQRMAGKRGGLKAFLLDQSRIAGIGNAYIHDILFLAGLHPLRKLESLSPAEIEALSAGIRGGLAPSLEKGGSFYEMDLFGQKGRFALEDIQVGYHEGQPCPRCATPIEKIKTGSTSSFLCPTCQPLK